MHLNTSEMINKKNKIIILTLSIFFISASLMSQTITVNGTVTDDLNQTLPGVNIVVKGTIQGTVTDMDGNFIVTAQRGDILIFKFISIHSNRI